MAIDNQNDTTDIEEPPPILSSWGRLYKLVFFNLIALIVLFYLFTRYFGA